MNAPSRRGIIVGRFCLGLLIAVLAAGLWQGYGSWLIERVRAHVA